MSFMLLPDGAVLKNLPAAAGSPRDMGSILGQRSPGGGNENPLGILVWRIL